MSRNERQLELPLKFPSPPKSRPEGTVRRRCAGCGRKVEVPKWYADEVELIFCSPECRRAWAGAAREPPKVVLEPRPEYRGGDWEVNAERARKRDRYTCRICGVTEKELGRKLDVHHILPFGWFKDPRDANRLSNLISVCPSCHRKLEAETVKDLPLFIPPAPSRRRRP
ncbi:MAG: hypothetical protein DRQ14_01400 [Candidatus Latescibacterota bacterium]|nr:MAG: hypothetical protein DRP99_03350 [Candidatus Latescibacterota bacterium]RKY65763.1 MAG: hypothetical protein DRQ08_04885 [Candidatus Latescibacterota bacterium]RKY74619.1 MAG: hypothetical protein DRQ14_01400 [Candidatus Latescibacterota bacterium]